MEFSDPKYREICNSVTLYSLQQGFFASFVETVIEKVGIKWINDVFARQQLDKDKIRICCTDSKAWEAINSVLKNVQKINRKKSAKNAYDARCEGIKCVQEGNFQKAISYFTQSVIKSPPLDEDKNFDDGKTLAFALKHRADALFEIHRFEDSITDLNLSLEEGFPAPLKYQIYRLIGNNYRELRDAKRAKISWQIALKLLEEQILCLETTEVKGSKKTKGKDNKLKQLLEKEREELKKALEEKWLNGGETSIRLGQQVNPQTFSEKPDIYKSTNEKFPNASSLVSIKRTVEHGRFAVAAEDIPTGATLVVEMPFASVLIPEKFGSHCHHCFKRLYTPVACKNCSGLAFCSNSCKIAAKTYHQYECFHMGLLQGSGMSVLSFLALRMITQEGFAFFKALQAKLEATKNKDPKVEFTSRENQYMLVYGLIHNANLRSPEDFFKRALMALFLTQCLKDTSFFSQSSLSPFSEDEILTASLIFRHLQMLQFNAYEICETLASARGVIQGSKSSYIALGIYSTAALFNHECAPTVTRYFHGKNIVIRNVQPLSKGSILSENYGPAFGKRTLAQRTRDLTSRYWFKCDCPACKEDWPTLEYLTDDFIKIRCSTPDCKMLFPQSPKTNAGICPFCFHTTKFADSLKRINNCASLFEKASSYMELGKSDMALPLIVNYLDKYFALGDMPCKNVVLAQEALRNCYAQTGNIFIVNN